MNKKVWGKKITLLKTKKLIIDLLFLKSNSFCSIHYHRDKTNIFVKLSGKIFIESFLLFNISPISSFLKWYNLIIVKPMEIHRFKVLKKALMIEIIYSPKEVKEDDIIRLKQGGRIIDNKEYTEDEIKGK